MTDSELLVTAAKAAGIDLQHKAMFGGDAEPGYYAGGSPPEWTWWNPLEDDGDAFRLAVRLNLDILQDPVAARSNKVEVLANEPADHEARPWDWQTRSPDPLAATRRAIVCTAAKMAI